MQTPDRPMTADLEIVLTDRAAALGKARLGLKREPLLKAATCAWTRGLRAADARGQLQRWMHDETPGGPGHHVRLWSFHLYIFRGRNLLNIITIPAHLRRSAVDAAAKHEP